jgi:hypothetical protein
VTVSIGDERPLLQTRQEFRRKQVCGVDNFPGRGGSFRFLPSMDQAEAKVQVKSAKYGYAGTKVHFSLWPCLSNSGAHGRGLLMQVVSTQKKGAGQGRVSVRYASAEKTAAHQPARSLAL